jgi:hypothetical protein
VTNKKQLTEDEIVAYLQRTTLPTVLVEGHDDSVVYRHVEERLGDLEVDVMTCNSRTMLLKIFERNEEFRGAPVIFVADKDMWYFTGVPAKYRAGIIFTTGYSIENDIYVRELFEGLLSNQEKQSFVASIIALSSWFAFEVAKFERTGACECDVHVGRLLEGEELNGVYLEKIGFVAPDGATVTRIVDNYREALRGKTLFQALLRLLSATSRASKYSRENLVEMGARVGNAAIDKIHAEVRTALLLMKEDTGAASQNA